MSRKSRRRNNNSNEDLEIEYKDTNIVEKNDTIEEQEENTTIEEESIVEEEIDNGPITNPPMSITLKDNTLIKVEPTANSVTYLYKDLCHEEKALCNQKAMYALACIKKGTVLDNVISVGDGWYRIVNGYVYNGEPEEKPYYMSKQGYTSRI